MATAEATSLRQSPPAASVFISVCESLCELGVLAILAISVLDEEPPAPGYKPAMVVLAAALLVLLVFRRSALLLRVEWGLLTGVGLATLLTTARYRWVGELEFFAQDPWWGVHISWAGLVGTSIALIYLIRSAGDRFRNIIGNPYALSIICAAAVFAAVEFALALIIRRSGTTVLLDTPFAFGSLALHFTTLLLLCSAQNSLWRARRLALLAIAGLAIKALLVKGGV